MKKNIANLIKVKTLVTFAIVAAFIILALRGDISPDNVVTITFQFTPPCGGNKYLAIDVARRIYDRMEMTE